MRDALRALLSRPIAPWVPWVLAAACALTWLPHMLVLAHLPSYGDEGIVAYGALRVYQGEVPYRDFFEFITPGSLYWVSAFYDVLGATFFALRLNVVVTGFLLVAGVLEIVRRLRLSLASAFVAAAAMAFFTGPAWLVASHHWDADTAMAWGAALLLGGTGSRWAPWMKPAAAGILSALAVLFLQDQGGAWLLLSVAALAASGSDGRKRLTPYLVGGLTAGMVAAAFLLAKVPLRELWYDLVVYPMTQYHNMPGNRGVILSHLAEGWKTATSTWSYHTSLLDWLRISATLLTFFGTVMVQLLPLAGALAAWIVLKRWGRTRRPDVAVILALFCTALLTAIRRPSDTAMIFALPFVLVVLSWALDDLLAQESRGPWNWAAVGWVTLFAGIAMGQCLLVWASPKAVTRTPSGPVYSLLMGEQETLQGVAAFASGRWRRGEEVFCYPYAPMFYFLFDLKNPTRHDILTYPQHTLEQVEEVRETLEARKTPYLIWSKAGSSAEAFELYLSRNYRPVADFKYAVVLERVAGQLGGVESPVGRPVR